jgi:hypothetical protein
VVSRGAAKGLAWSFEAMAVAAVYFVRSHMPYATVVDVQRRMPQFQLTASSRPNLDAAQVFLDDTIAQFESAMENLGYVVPITGEKALKQCREIVCQGTIAKILYARGAAIGTDTAVQSADRAQKQYDHHLKMLASPSSPVELTDAARTSDELRKPGPGPDGLRDVEPRVSMDTPF